MIKTRKEGRKRRERERGWRGGRKEEATQRRGVWQCFMQGSKLF
jgi:hypothetical protein